MGTHVTVRWGPDSTFLGTLHPLSSLSVDAPPGEGRESRMGLSLPFSSPWERGEEASRAQKTRAESRGHRSPRGKGHTGNAGPSSTLFHVRGKLLWGQTRSVT